MKILPCLNSGWVQLPVFEQGIIALRMRKISDRKTHFWSMVEIGPCDECWKWKGGRDFRLDDRYSVRPQKASWLLSFGDIEKGRLIYPICNDKKCVNPSHLKSITIAEKNEPININNRIDVEKRFWEKVNKNTESGCWEWTAGMIKGYGQIRISGRNVFAHRFSCELAGKKIPDNLLACHSCDNRKCVNPDHIFPGTYMDNYMDAVNKGRIVIGNYRRVGLPTIERDIERCYRNEDQ